MLEDLETYISAQKTIAHYMMGFGVIMVLLAIFLHFTGTNTVFNGLKIGLLVVGLLSAGGGYGYRITEDKLLSKQSELYEQDQKKFQVAEHERMQKVLGKHPYILIGMSAVIAILLILIFFVKNNLIQGILFSVIIYLLGNLIIETISKNSIQLYFDQLSKFQ